MENKYRNMNHDELIKVVYDPSFDDLPRMEKDQIQDRLCAIAWGVARMLDRTHGIDPLKGKETAYGTRNHRSYTYKVRKAVGFSYP